MAPFAHCIDGLQTVTFAWVVERSRPLAARWLAV